MIDDDDDAATAIPERTERTDSGAHVTESGRHVNRNVVPRGAPGEPRRDWPGPPSPHDDAFDLVTPVRPEPRDVFEEEDATLSHEPDGVPVAAPPGGAPDRARPVTPSPRPEPEVTSEPQSGRAVRITPSDAGFTVRGPVTDRMARIAPTPDVTPPEPPVVERGPRLTPPRPGFATIEPQPPVPADSPCGRSARITPSDAGFVPPESRRPGTEREQRITL